MPQSPAKILIRVIFTASRHSGMYPAGIQKRFLDTGLKPAGMTNGNPDTYVCGAVLARPHA